MFNLDKPLIIIGVILIAGVTGISYALYKAVEKDNRLLQQCLNDGRKEYECVAMLRGNMPSLIIIPQVR